jgi:hypothetical protein
MLIGMSTEEGLLISFGGTFSRSFTTNLGETNSICQISMADFGIIEGGQGTAQITWLDVEFADPEGNFRVRNLGDLSFFQFDEVHSFAQDHALIATFLVKLTGHTYVSWVLDKFFWDEPV